MGELLNIESTIESTGKVLTKQTGLPFDCSLKHFPSDCRSDTLPTTGLILHSGAIWPNLLHL